MYLWASYEKKMYKKICLHPETQWRKESDPDPETDPDPLVRGTDPGIRIRTKLSRIPNTACKSCTLSIWACSPLSICASLASPLHSTSMQVIHPCICAPVLRIICTSLQVPVQQILQATSVHVSALDTFASLAPLHLCKSCTSVQDYWLHLCKPVQGICLGSMSHILGLAIAKWSVPEMQIAFAKILFVWNLTRSRIFNRIQNNKYWLQNRRNSDLLWMRLKSLYYWLKRLKPEIHLRYLFLSQTNKRAFPTTGSHSKSVNRQPQAYWCGGKVLICLEQWIWDCCSKTTVGCMASYKVDQSWSI